MLVLRRLSVQSGSFGVAQRMRAESGITGVLTTAGIVVLWAGLCFAENRFLAVRML